MSKELHSQRKKKKFSSPSCFLSRNRNTTGNGHRNQHVLTPFYKLNRADPCEGVQPLTLAMDCVGRVGVGLQP